MRRTRGRGREIAIISRERGRGQDGNYTTDEQKMFSPSRPRPIYNFSTGRDGRSDGTGTGTDEQSADIYLG